MSPELSETVLYRERTSQDRHETPSGVRYERDARQGSLRDDRGLYDAHRPPESLWEALMVAPGVEVRMNGLQGHLVGLGIEAMLLLCGLTPKERAVVDMLVFGQMTLSQVGYHLGLEYKNDCSPYSKAYVAKIRESAFGKLRERLA